MTFTHGVSGYGNNGCRCDICTAAHSAAMGNRRYAYTAEHGLPDGIEHGASAYGNWGCHCQVCKDGANAKRKASYHAKINREREARSG